MEGQRSKKHWLNPLYRSETESTVCSMKSAPLLSTETRNPHSEKNMNRFMRCISQSWKTIKTLPSASSFGSRDDKEVVMEGYLPTTKQSLLNFLKGMGLKPKVDLVGKETIIIADASEIRDAALKNRFIKFMKKQVIDTPRTALTEASSTSVASTNSKASSAPAGKSKESSETSKDTSRTSQSCEPTAYSKKGKIWTPPKEVVEEADSKDKKKSKKKKVGPTGSDGKQDDKKTPSQNKNTDDACTKKDEKKKEKSVGFNTVGMVPVVGHVGNPFERQIPIGTHITVTDEDEHVNEPGNIRNQGYSQESYRRANGYGITKASPLAWKQSAEDQPSCDNQHLTVECDSPVKVEKKKKKLRIAKHLRKWFSKKKDTGEQVTLEISKDSGNTGTDGQSCSLSRETYNFHPMCQFQTVSVAPEPDRAPLMAKLNTDNHGIQRKGNIQHVGVPVSAKLYVDRQQQNVRKNVESTNERPQKVKINPQAFDGSISMPVLLTPDKSFFKAKQLSSKLLEASKSSTVATDKCQAKDSYSVVGDSAAIHIGRKRIRLEGEDVKYGSILQKDKDFDKHFSVLKENSLSDIESQVKKVKDRIMFARAMGALGDRLPEDSPKVNYEELLIPKNNSKGKRAFDRRSHVDVATTSSFYQKFLASMNILKTTHRFDACDRSVMTDEPLSKTYAEFINTMNARNSHHDKSSISGQSRSSMKSGVTVGDSSADLPATSYLKMICTCWEPLFKFFPDNSNNNNDCEQSSNRRPPENMRTEEERILKCIVDKVLDCSRNKKGYIKTEIKPS